MNEILQILAIIGTFFLVLGGILWVADYWFKEWLDNDD